MRLQRVWKVAFFTAASILSACGPQTTFIELRAQGDVPVAEVPSPKDAGNVTSESPSPVVDGGMNDGALPELPPQACGELLWAGSRRLRPVDIIFVVDNSASMETEIRAVERNINTNFAGIIGASRLDYRVIMLSEHGTDSSSRKKVCITAPLSGNGSCSPIPAIPVNGDRFFHYSTFIDSWDSLTKIVQTYHTPDNNGLPQGGWSTWLRPEAWKVFIEITDDETHMDWAEFDKQLLALTPANFGSASQRNYVFHSITGLRANSPADKPWSASDALQSNKCASAVGPGDGYQRLSILTGGLRFPVCENNSFDVVFRAVAEGVLEGVPATCDHELPEVPLGRTLQEMKVAYAPGTGAAIETLSKREGPWDCDTAGYYLEGTTLKLCPSTCIRVQDDNQAQVTVSMGCQPIME